MIALFVWSAVECFDFVVDVCVMWMRVIEYILLVIAEWEIKLGCGGLCDVEFVV